MVRYMFGLGSDPVRSAQKLKALGYDGVVLGTDVNAIQAAQNAGLEVWLCYGAHSLGAFSQAQYGAVDANGEPAPWFGSGCPNAAEISSDPMASAIRCAKETGVTGVFVDGARFASFASAEGLFHFFGCFCPRCVVKMGTLGINGNALRATVSRLMAFLRGESASVDLAALREGLQTMLRFRAQCVGAYMRAFADQAHAASLRAGAFVFAPSLCDFVGQSFAALAPLDVIAPMLYRDYPHRIGTACMNHEWTAFRTLVSGTAYPPEQLAEELFGVAHLPRNPMAGFPPEAVAAEVSAACAASKGQEILPIIQTEDPLLAMTVRCVLEAGAQGCGEFYYDQKAF